MTHFLKTIDNVIKAFNGCLVLGDIHNEYESLVEAADYAIKNNLYIITLGDIVDYGDDAYNTVRLVNDLMDNNHLSSVKGNHDYKIERYYEQKRNGSITLVVKPCMDKTIQSLEKDDGEALFHKMCNRMPYVIRFKNTFMTHGAIHRSILMNGFDFDAFDKNRREYIRSLCLFGEINKLEPQRSDGYPIRSYNWVKHIVEPYNAIVGHDIRGREPVFDGSVCFTDCGCGKGGNLFGIRINIQGCIIGYVEF